MVKRSAWGHPKLERLGMMLDLQPWAVVGIVESFWHWVSRYAPNGDVTRDLELMPRWIGYPEGPRLIQALVAVELIDVYGNAYLVHDWPDHADDAVKKSLARAGVICFGDGTPISRRPDGVEPPARQRLTTGSPPAPNREPASSPPEPCLSQALPEPEPEPVRARKRAQTDPPEFLEVEVLRKIQAWAASEHPELQAEVPDLVATCLDHFRGKGERRASWPATCRTWIRNEARYRQQRGRNGSARASPRSAFDALADDMLENPLKGVAVERFTDLDG